MEIMKNFIKIVVLVIPIVSWACRNLAIEPEQKTLASRVDYHISGKDIEAYLALNYGYSSTKASSINIEPVVCESDTVFYIVNYEKGWEVLSGDKRAPKVLIKCEGGNITKEDLYSSPAQRAFIRALEINLSKALHDDSFYSSADIKDSWLSCSDSTQGKRYNGFPKTDRGYTVVERTVIQSDIRDHLLSTKWGQDGVWSIRAPYTDSTLTYHCSTGCVAVATAQVLYYLHYKIGKPVGTYGFSTCNAFVPSSTDSLVLSPSDISFTYCAPLHWVDMPLTSTSSGQYEKVSTLMMRIGYLYGAVYHSGRTGSNLDQAITFFPSEFSISCSKTQPITVSQLASVSRNQIFNNELPIMMSVKDTTQKAGHAIVLDGYKFLEESVTYYHYYYELGGGVSCETYTVIEVSSSLAINWGWDGSGDSDDSGNTIWYNIATPWIASSYNYTKKNYIISNFAAI